MALSYEASLALRHYRRRFPCHILSLPAAEDVLSARVGVERALRVQRHRRGCLRVVRASAHRRPAAEERSLLGPRRHAGESATGITFLDPVRRALLDRFAGARAGNRYA